MGTQLLYFWGNWCVPCRTFGPLLQRVAESLNVPVVKIDADEHPEMIEEFQIMSLPTVVVMKEGSVAAILVGSLTEEQLRSGISPHA